MVELSYWIIFLDFLNNNQGLIIFFELIASIITTGIFIGILIITKKYAIATKEIADKTSESVEASKKLSETTIQIEKDRLTYVLINDWLTDKKFLTYRRKELGIIRKDGTDIFYLMDMDLENGKKFIDYMNSFQDYFMLIYNLLGDEKINEKINKNLFFKILGKEIIKFKNKQFEENADIYSDVLRKLREKYLIDLPIISDREWFDKIFKIASEEYKFQ